VPVLHDPRGRLLIDTVLLDPGLISLLFSLSRAYFMVDMPVPANTVHFLRSIMPHKPRAELYSMLGLGKQGKTSFYRGLFSHLHHSADQFITAPGIKGLVMLVFTLPSYPYVFKVIKDKFGATKEVDHATVKRKYQLVKQVDRVGRMADTLEFSQVSLPKHRCAPELLDMLWKNFGVTRYGRVVFYDYDEIEYMTDCNFRRIPSAPNPEAEMSGEPWYSVARNDVFPEEFGTFLLGNPCHYIAIVRPLEHIGEAFVLLFGPVEGILQGFPRPVGMSDDTALVESKQGDKLEIVELVVRLDIVWRIGISGCRSNTQGVAVSFGTAQFGGHDAAVGATRVVADQDRLSQLIFERFGKRPGEQVDLGARFHHGNHLDGPIRIFRRVQRVNHEKTGNDDTRQQRPADSSHTFSPLVTHDGSPLVNGGNDMLRRRW